MARSVQQVNTVVRSEFTVYNDSDTPVTGLVDANFTKLLTVGGVDSSLAVTVNEIDPVARPGEYTATFMPTSMGAWYLLIRQPTYNPRGWDESFDVTLGGSDIYSYVADGYTFAQMLELVGAALSGTVVNAPLNPTFMSMNGGTVRITAVCDGNGNRTVTLSP